MSRRRYISTDISTDVKTAELAEHGTMPLLLYTWAIPHMDDWGRMTGDARQFKLLVCPALDISSREVDEALNQITSVGLWERYEVDGKQVISIEEDSWFKHQSYINKAKRGDDSGSNYPKTPKNAEERRESPQKAASLSPSPSPSLSSTTGEGVIETLDKVHELVFGKLIFSPQMSAFIRRIKDKGHTDAFIKELLLEAGESSTAGAPSMRYLETIFESWDREGIYTRIEAKARRDNAKQKPQRQPVHFNHAMQLQKENEGRNEQPMDGFFDAG